MKNGWKPFDVWGGTGSMDTRILTIIPLVLYFFKQEVDHEFNSHKAIKYGVSITPFISIGIAWGR